MAPSLLQLKSPPCKASSSAWPPSSDVFLAVAKASAQHLHKNHATSVLVYMDNPTIPIFDPVHFSPAPRIAKSFAATTSENTTHDFQVVLAQYD